MRALSGLLRLTTPAGQILRSSRHTQGLFLLSVDHPGFRGGSSKSLVLRAASTTVRHTGPNRGPRVLQHAPLTVETYEGRLAVLGGHQQLALMKDGDDLQSQLLKGQGRLSPVPAPASEHKAAPATASHSTSDLNENVTQLTTELYNLAQQVASLVMDNAHLNTKVKKLSDEKTEMSEMMDLLRLDNKSLKSQLKTLDTVGQQVNILVKEGEELNNRLDTMSQEKAELKFKMEDMSKANTDLKEELKQFLEKHSAMKSSMGDLTKESKFLYDKMEEMWNNSKGLYYRMDNLTGQVKELLSQPTTTAAINNQINQIVTSSSDLARQMVQLEGDLSKLKQEYSSMKSLAHDMDKQLQQVSRDGSSLHSTVEYLRQNETSSESKLSNLSHDLSNLKMQLQGMDHNAATLGSQITSVTNDVSTLGQQVSTIDQTTGCLRNDVSRLQQEQNNTKSDLGRLEHSTTTLGSQIQQLKSTESAQNSQLQKLSQEDTALGRDLSLLQNATVSQGMEINTLKSECSSLNSQVSGMTSQLSSIQYTSSSNAHGSIATQAAGKVSFHAVGVPVTKLPANSPVVFHDVQNNNGSSYNSNTGEFVAPYDGTYCFMASAETGGVCSSQHGDVNVGLELRVDGQKVLDRMHATRVSRSPGVQDVDSMLAESDPSIAQEAVTNNLGILARLRKRKTTQGDTVLPSQTDNQSGSMHAIVTLKAGQKVSVVTTEDSVFKTRSPSTAFSGFLLF